MLAHMQIQGEKHQEVEEDLEWINLKIWFGRLKRSSLLNQMQRKPWKFA
jgi:hypothetical protein